jgi:hypothetical protein
VGALPAMRRTLASLLLALVSLPLIAPLLLASDAGLPACCRRNGEHHCSMAPGSMGPDSDSTGPAINSVRSKCPFPGTAIPSGNAGGAIFGNSQPGAIQLVLQVVVRTQTETQRSVAAGRAHGKRGPPTFQS